MHIVTHKYFWVGAVSGIAGYLIWQRFVGPAIAVRSS